jgi:cell division septation protein DedD
VSTPQHAPRTPFLLLLGALVVGGLCALLALNTASAANELNRHDLATKDASIAAEVQQLRNEVAASAAPGNIASAAAAMGMVPAGNPAFLKVLPDGRVVVLGSASAASLAPAPTSSPPSHPPTTTAKTTKTTKPPTSSTAKRTSRSTPTATPTPTPTPTPTTTLPGGTR